MSKNMSIIGRAKIINFFITWSFTLKLKEQTLFLSINLFDNFLAKNRIKNEKISILFISCIFLSIKYEEVKVLKLKKLLNFITDEIDENEIYLMEVKILESVDYNLIFINPFDFMKRLFFLTNCDDKDYIWSCYLLEILAFFQDFNSFEPSHLAFACFFLTLKMRGKIFDFLKIKKYFFFDLKIVKYLESKILFFMKKIKDLRFFSVDVKYNDFTFIKNYVVDDQFLIDEF